MRHSALGRSLGVAEPAVKPAAAMNVPVSTATQWGCGTSKVSLSEGATVRDLVERAQNGDRDAFAALVGMTSDRMYALAARILRDSVLAEDALQGALITVWRQLPTLRDPDRFEAWVRRLLDPRVLRRGQAPPHVGGERPCPAGRRAGRSGWRSCRSTTATHSTGRSDA